MSRGEGRALVTQMSIPLKKNWRMLICTFSTTGEKVGGTALPRHPISQQPKLGCPSLQILRDELLFMSYFECGAFVRLSH